MELIRVIVNISKLSQYFLHREKTFESIKLQEFLLVLSLQDEKY